MTGNGGNPATKCAEDAVGTTSEQCERRGSMVYGEDRGPGTAPHIADCASIEQARRIVACMNICAGFPTDVLERHAVRVILLSPYEARVAQLEAEGLTTSDAQSIADVEGLSESLETPAQPRVG